MKLTNAWKQFVKKHKQSKNELSNWIYAHKLAWCARCGHEAAEHNFRSCTCPKFKGYYA